MRSMVAIAVLACLTPLAGVAGESMQIEAKIPLGAVKGRIDHMAVDLGRQRLLVAELGNDTVGVVDLAARRVVGRITGLKEPQGVAYIPGADLIHVANAGDGAVRRYRAADLSPAGVTKLSGDADNLRFDAKANQLLVGYGDGALAMLDAASGEKLGEIALPAHPESFQLASYGSLAYVNLPKAKRVAVVDRAARSVVGSWSFAPAGANFPMAFDAEAGQVLVVYRSPPTLAAFDQHTGTAASLPTCGDADDLFIDAKRQRIYVSCGEGAVAIIGRRGATLVELGRVATVSGARTSLFVPSLDRLYLAVRASGNEPAAIWVLRAE